MIRWQLNYHLTKWLLVVGLLATVLILVACGRSTTLPLQQDKIAFVSDRDGNPEIYIMDADGSKLTNLTNNPGSDILPVWSPDGSKIAFTSMRDVGSNEIYVMDADGSNQTNLTNSPTNDVFPAWSPDSSKIAFVVSNLGEGGREIYVMDADGSNLTKLTDTPSMGGAGEIYIFPALVWSPDGSKIAFVVSNLDNKLEIYVMDADGSNPTNLTNNSAYDVSPAWSPDGSKIAFVSTRGGGGGEIYVMDADGSNLTKLTNSPADDAFLVWSPDGSKIASVSYRHGNMDIYIMDDDGSNLMNLTNNPADDGASDFSFLPELVWSPDGSKIAFVSYRDGNPEIHVMDADGSNPTNLTNNPAEDHFPAWSP